MKQRKSVGARRDVRAVSKVNKCWWKVRVNNIKKWIATIVNESQLESARALMHGLYEESLNERQGGSRQEVNKSQPSQGYNKSTRCNDQ